MTIKHIMNMKDDIFASPTNLYGGCLQSYANQYLRIQLSYPYIHWSGFLLLVDRFVTLLISTVWYSVSYAFNVMLGSCMYKVTLAENKVLDYNISMMGTIWWYIPYAFNIVLWSFIYKVPLAQNNVLSYKITMMV